MSVRYVLENVESLESKFKALFIQKKKIAALENYAEVAPFSHKDYLPLIKKCMNDGFLDEAEEMFLTHLVNKYRINFLDWSHKTQWLKQEMRKERSKNPEKAEEQYTLFNFENALRGPVSTSITAYMPQHQHQKRVRI